MKPGWQAALNESFHSDALFWDEDSLAKFSNDLHHLSPVLDRDLKGKTADCIIFPATYEQLDAVISVAVEYDVPLTPRGGGSANYGQCVPLTGGIVIDFTKMDKILEIGDGFMRVEPGANMAKMEAAAWDTGQELLLFPTTYKKSTIAGFISGGFAGVGAVTWGTIWDGMVKGLTVKTVEKTSRSYIVKGNDIMPYIHAYGTIGILSEVVVALVPRVQWKQWAVSFVDWVAATKFGLDIAENAMIQKRLVSIDEWPIPSYFTPFKLAAGRSVALLEISTDSEFILKSAVEKWGGQIDMEISAEEYHKGLGVSDFSFGHSRLWVQKTDPSYTNLQITLDTDRFAEQISTLKEEYPDLLVQIEIIRKAGRLLITARPIYKYGTEERISRLMSRCMELNIKVDSSHTYDLESGNRAYDINKLWEIKGINDPHGLLNQMKLAKPKSAV
jgi:FAD/FMN-containing dehydrogenase